MKPQDLLMFSVILITLVAFVGWTFFYIKKVETWCRKWVSQAIGQPIKTTGLRSVWSVKDESCLMSIFLMAIQIILAIVVMGGGYVAIIGLLVLFIKGFGLA